MSVFRFVTTAALVALGSTAGGVATAAAGPAPDWRSAPVESLAYPPPVGSTRPVSVRPRGQPAVGYSGEPSSSSDGRYVAFVSQDTGLVLGVELPPGQLYIRDLETATTTVASISSAGEPGNDGAGSPSISADGTRVAFTSYSSNLTPGDKNGTSDVFLHDVATGTTELVSHTKRGKSGRYASFRPSISADGTRVAFTSESPDLVRRDANGASDVFVYDTATRSMTVVSRTPRGKSPYGNSFSPAISADGSRIAFQSLAPDLVEGDTNDDVDVFVADVATARSELVSRGFNGEPADGGSFRPTISGDGARVCYLSYARNLDPDHENLSGSVFLWDATAKVSRVIDVSPDGEPANGYNDSSAISADGTRVTFASTSSNLVSDDNNGTFDIFAYDAETGGIALISRNRAGQPANSSSTSTAISGDGTRIVYESNATDLVQGDTNGVRDVFVYRLS